MPTVTYEHATIRSLLSRYGVVHDPDLWEAQLSNIGCVVEGSNSEEIEIEVFPDRADLLSVETMTRAARSFLHQQPQAPILEVKNGDMTMEVDSDIANIRPVILAAAVRGVDTGSNTEEREAFIQSLMDHQEKLHITLGRRRRLASIGVHDLNSLAPPFKVRSVGREHRFVPLAMDEAMSIDEILESHPKGMEYAHLLEGMESVPVIEDAVGLSLIHI